MAGVRNTGWAGRILSSGAITVGLIGAWAGSVGAVTHHLKPTAVLRVSSTALTRDGGAVTLTARTHHARLCRFSAVPAVHGLPVVRRCSSGTARRTVVLPADGGDSPVTYRFAVIATGRGGTARSAAVVTVGASHATGSKTPSSAPSISALTASPTGLPPSGGTVTISFSTQGSTSCTLSASPSVSGLPSTMPCPSSASATPFTLPVKLPALSGTTSRRFTLTVTATGAGSTTSASTTVTVWPFLQFSTPQPADTADGDADAISCASSAFCVIVDEQGNAVTYNGSSWGAPVRAGAPQLDTVSCVVTTFCVAGGEEGDLDVFNGTSWTTSTTLPDAVTSVSCPTTTFCIALATDDNGYVYDSVFSDGSWSAATLLAGSPSVSPPPGDGYISCASPTFCAAITSDGWGLGYNGHAWSLAAVALLADPGPDSISCPSTSFCVALDAYGDTFGFNGSGWSSAVSTGAEGGEYLVAISCSSAEYCVAVDSDYNIYSYDLDGWTGPASPNPPSDTPGGPVALSCPSADFCAVVNADGTAAIGSN